MEGADCLDRSGLLQVLRSLAATSRLQAFPAHLTDCARSTFLTDLFVMSFSSRDPSTAQAGFSSASLFSWIGAVAIEVLGILLLLLWWPRRLMLARHDKHGSRMRLFVSSWTSAVW